MSLLKELGLSENDINCASPRLRDRILEGYTKIRGLELLRRSNSFDRDSKRLDAQAREVRKQQGIDMPDPEDETIILGDNNQPMLFGLPTAIVLVLGTLAAILLFFLLLAGLMGLAWWMMEMLATDPDSADKITNVTPGFGDPDNIQRP